jgi:hypothetical protein
MNFFLSLKKKITDTLLPYYFFDHAIDLKDSEYPPWGPIYTLSKVKIKALRNYLDDMLCIIKIKPSKSFATIPILFIPKPLGIDRWLCIEYQGLKRVIVFNQYSCLFINKLRD